MLRTVRRRISDDNTCCSRRIIINSRRVLSFVRGDVIPLHISSVLGDDSNIDIATGAQVVEDTSSDGLRNKGDGFFDLNKKLEEFTSSVIPPYHLCTRIQRSTSRQENQIPW